MATYCSILAWRVPWTEEPGGLQSKGSQSVGYHWAVRAADLFSIWYCMFPGCSLHSSHPLLPRLCSQVCSPCLHLHCCPANRFIGTILETKIDLRKNSHNGHLAQAKYMGVGSVLRGTSSSRSEEIWCFSCPVWAICLLAVCSVTQSCPTLCNPIDCSPSDYSVHGIFQARFLEWVAISLSGGIFPTQGLKLCLQCLLHC